MTTKCSNPGCSAPSTVQCVLTYPETGRVETINLCRAHRHLLGTLLLSLDPKPQAEERS